MYCYIQSSGKQCYIYKRVFNTIFASNTLFMALKLIIYKYIIYIIYNIYIYIIYIYIYIYVHIYIYIYICIYIYFEQLERGITSKNTNLPD